MNTQQAETVTELVQKSIENHNTMIQMLGKMNEEDAREYLPKVKASIEETDRLVKSLRS